MGVECNGHVEQDLTLLYPPNKVLDTVLQLVGGLVDLLRVTLARLSQLLRCLQKLIGVGVRVLSQAHGHHTYGQSYSTETYIIYTLAHYNTEHTCNLVSIYLSVCHIKLLHVSVGSPNQSMCYKSINLLYYYLH